MIDIYTLKKYLGYEDYSDLYRKYAICGIYKEYGLLTETYFRRYRYPYSNYEVTQFTKNLKNFLEEMELDPQTTWRKYTRSFENFLNPYDDNTPIYQQRKILIRNLTNLQPTIEAINIKL